MGKAKKTRTASVKRMIKTTDERLKANAAKSAEKLEKSKAQQVKHVAQMPSSMFMSHNTALAPPYRVLVDTNFINLSLEERIEMMRGMMDCLYAKCIPCISDCVMAEIEKLGPKFRLALRVAKDPRFERLPCSHRGSYADDCIVDRVTSHRCYVVATCDRALRRRLRKIPGVPLMYISKKRYAIERLPDMGVPS